MTDRPAPTSPDDSPSLPDAMREPMPAGGRRPYPVDDPGFADPEGPGSEPDVPPMPSTGPHTTM